eukprot:scaffold1624_cov105-Cylindrotheca_fusiformis.AAC.10
MKFTIFTIIAATTTAFTPSAVNMRNPTQLSATAAPPDFVEEAMEATRKYGPQSPEARLAWETVEEMDASDNSAATYEVPADYERNMKLLAEKIKDHKPTVSAVRNMAEDMKSVKLSQPKPKVAAPPSAELKEAIANAKKVTAELGVHSAEAQIAWEIVEEIASSGRSGNAMGGMLTAEECLVDAAQEACDALVELDRALHSSN